MRKLTTEEYINKAKKIHGEKCDYSNTVYTNSRTLINICCPIHGEFSQMPKQHLNGDGCPKCGNVLSNAENEIYDFIIKNTNYKVTQRRRDIIKPYEIDIFIEDLKIGIEYHGIYWHSDKFKKNNSHYDKLTLCKNNGIKLIQIFEDEWNDNKEIVLSKISHLLNIPNITDKIMARKTKIQVIDKNTAQFFLNKNHIQGYANATVNFGCFYNDTLIGVMSFKKINDKLWELTRFASDYNYICCGVGGKLFKHFIREYKPELVKSFADRRWTIDEENNIYIQLGFKFDGYTRPDYKYLKSNTIQRIHKFNFRKKSLLRKYPNILNENMTENEMAKKLGYYKIYDCGLIRYVWKNNL